MRILAIILALISTPAVANHTVTDNDRWHADPIWQDEMDRREFTAFFIGRGTPNENFVTLYRSETGEWVALVTETNPAGARSAIAMTGVASE